MKKLVFILLTIILNVSVIFSQDDKFSIQLGVMRSLDGLSVPLGVSGTYQYCLGEKYSITGSIGYYMYNTKTGEFLGGDYGHSLIPVTVGARYNFKNTGSGFYSGVEAGILYHTNNDINRSYLRWEMLNNAINQSRYYSFSPLLGYTSQIDDNLDLDITLKYLIVSSGSCAVLNAGINF